MAAAVERAERGGSRNGIRIGDQLSPAQSATIERIDTRLGSPPRTIMLGGWRVSLEESQSRHSQQSRQRMLSRESRLRR